MRVLESGASGGPVEAPVRIGRAPAAPSSPYLDARPPAFALEQTTRIARPPDEVFAFFANARNLGPMTPPRLHFRIETPTPIEMRAGTEIRYRLRLGGVPLRWRTRIERWEPGVSFVDVQEAGPYRCWWHEHRFRAVPGGTRMDDRVLYATPGGALANSLFVAPQLRSIFAFRARAIARRFGLIDRGR